MSVHSTHCCKIHGCKYGDEDCPVVNGEEVQEYPCEDCSEPLEIRLYSFEDIQKAFKAGCMVYYDDNDGRTEPFEVNIKENFEQFCKQFSFQKT